MSKIKNFFLNLKKNKFSKVVLIGGFVFFSVKGIIWLVILFLAYAGIESLF